MPECTCANLPRFGSPTGGKGIVEWTCEIHGPMCYRKESKPAIPEVGPCETCGHEPDEHAILTTAICLVPGCNCDHYAYDPEPSVPFCPVHGLSIYADPPCCDGNAPPPESPQPVPDDHPLSKFADAAFKAAEKRLDQRDRLCDTLSDIRRELRAKPTQLSALEWRCLALADDALEAIANDR